MTRTPDTPTGVLHGAVADPSIRHGVVDLLLVTRTTVSLPDGGADVDVAYAEHEGIVLHPAATGAAASRSDGRVDVERVGVVA